MKRLAIVDYVCGKPRNKRFGHITFLHARDGSTFLAAHGQLKPTNSTRPVSRLRFMETDVFCDSSKRDPQPLALKSLEYFAECRQQKRLQDPNEHWSSDPFHMLASSCGYCTFVGEQLSYVPEVAWKDPGTLRFTKQNMIVKMAERYLVRIPIATIIELVWFTDGSLTLTLSTVPFFFSIVASLANLLSLLGIREKNGASESCRNRICALDTEHAELVGHCLVYQFNVSPMDLARLVEELNKREISHIRFDLTPTIPRALPGQFMPQVRALKRELADYTKTNTLPFQISFQLQALVYNAYLLPSTVSSLAKELILLFKKSRELGKRALSVDSLRRLFDILDYPTPYGNPVDFEVSSLLELLKKNEQEVHDGFAQRKGLISLPSHLTQVCRASVSPSRITLHGPEIEPSNRILRRFPNHHEYFIRVQFCDENGQGIHFSPRVDNTSIFDRFKNVIRNGIEIAGRTYTFLGFSHSSLRSHSVWFSAPFFDDNGVLQTYFSIIKALGNFSKMTSPARCAARIGQAFSDTPFTVNLKDSDISVGYIPDVSSQDGSRVFSDGVGAVSWDAMEAIWSKLPSKKGSPTCFQIRMGGAKGMLALDTRLPGSVVQLRPSMIKFDTDDVGNLEICTVSSKPIPLVLNRQMIKILEDMGVSSNWFMKLQNAEITNLREVTANAKTMAKFMQVKGIGDSVRLHKLFYFCYFRSIDILDDVFLRSVVEAVVLRELRLLKHKARIPVKEAMTLFGVMDETGYLQEGEVYVAYDSMSGLYADPPGAGSLIVTRSPALYDGDIQFVQSVVPPEGHPLAEHNNCIVFSQKGIRDLPSQLSGGDLDGDIYNVIWDKEAIPTSVFRPADYPRVAPIDIGRPVNKDDMADFFVHFMMTDRLGVIATKHMILADQKEEGSCHEDCKKLAQLHSTAVDFSKTGIPVDMNEIPRVSPYRPDFLAPGPETHIYDKSRIELEAPTIGTTFDEDEDFGPPHKYYRSEKVLGQLYRAIDEGKIWYEDVQVHQDPNPTRFWDNFVRTVTERCSIYGFVKWQHRTDEARHIRSAYEDAIFTTMNNFSEHPINPLSEVEVFIGNILNKTGSPTHHQRERSIKLKDEVERISPWIMSLLRQHGDTGVAPTGDDAENDALELCLACVHIGCEGDQSARVRHRRGWDGELKSFRVVAACALLGELEMFDKGVKGE